MMNSAADVEDLLVGRMLTGARGIDRALDVRALTSRS